MTRIVIHLLMALDVVLVVWGQETFPPVVPSFPPPPTPTPVINESLIVFVGEPVIVGQDVRVTIDCGQLINETIDNGTANPVVTWCKDGREISNGSEIHVIISADSRFCIITETLMAVGGQLGNDGHYTCKVCDSSICKNDTSPVEFCSPPHFAQAVGDPLVFPGFIALTCGQDATVQTLAGAAVSLFCSIFSGSDPFTLGIYKDGALISDTSSYDIVPASDDDFGTYTFRILNKCGEDTKVTRILRQGVPPDIDEGPFIPPPDTVTPEDVIVSIGSPAYIIFGYDVTIVCKILTGTPPVSITWLRNGMPEDPPRGSVTTITVTDATDGDVFTCRANNNIGFDSKDTAISATQNCSVSRIRGKVICCPKKRQTTVRFSTDGDPSAMYRCRLDGGAFSACESPVAWNNLTEGDHVFVVRAKCVDFEGNITTVRKRFKFQFCLFV